MFLLSAEILRLLYHGVLYRVGLAQEEQVTEGWWFGPWLL